ncbi:MAG: metal-sensing transcriptional repressor [Oscillospiraceae bacterium]|nr:metal-sensing transcriptional repressor [Clostridiales bacterium]MDY2691970.1 metal-sensing transcriptional repressor [Oscillospiraceae bacterium]
MEHDHEYLHEHHIAHLHTPQDVHTPEQAQEHEHLHEHTHPHDHDHAHEPGAHGHVHANTKAVINRLARAIGHLESVKKMVEDGRDCSEVLIQIAAVRSAINNIGKVILQDHIQHCIVDAVEQDDEQALDSLCQAIDKFIK